MRELAPFETIHNPTVGALAMWAFVQSYCNNDKKGVHILLTLPVLPMVFHEETAKAISIRRFERGLMISLREDRTMTKELQKRTENMLHETFRAIHFALAAQLIRTDDSKLLLLSNRITTPTGLKSICPDIVAASRRLGAWFATTDKDILLSQLEVSV